MEFHTFYQLANQPCYNKSPIHQLDTFSLQVKWTQVWLVHISCKVFNAITFY